MKTKIKLYPHIQGKKKRNKEANTKEPIVDVEKEERKRARAKKREEKKAEKPKVEHYNRHQYAFLTLSEQETVVGEAIQKAAKKSKKEEESDSSEQQTKKKV